MNKCKFLGLINLQVPREGKKKKRIWMAREAIPGQKAGERMSL